MTEKPPILGSDAVDAYEVFTIKDASALLPVYSSESLRPTTSYSDAVTCAMLLYKAHHENPKGQMFCVELHVLTQDGDKQLLSNYVWSKYTIEDYNKCVAYPTSLLMMSKVARTLGIAGVKQATAYVYELGGKGDAR